MGAATMNCPACAVPLSMSAREGIEIDYCPSCRGVWLDRGELDKIVQRSGASPFAEEQRERPHSRHHDDDHWRPREPHHQRRRKSFLEELFD